MSAILEEVYNRHFAPADSDKTNVYKSVVSSDLPRAIQDFINDFSITRFGDFNKVPLFDAERLLTAIRGTKMRVCQIVFIYSDGGDHVLSQYESGVPAPTQKGESDQVADDPAFFGIMTHDDERPEAISLSFLMDKDIRQGGVPKEAALKRIVAYYKNIIDIIMREGVTLDGDIPAFAGIGLIPGLLIKEYERNRENSYVSKGVYNFCTQKNVESAQFVSEAVMRTCQNEGFAANDNVVVLGHLGILGSDVIKILKNNKMNVQGVDSDKAPEGERAKHYFENLSTTQRSRLLVVDCTMGGALEIYGVHLHEGDIWLNEAYGTVPSDVIGSMKAQGVEVHHIRGVNGTSIPPLIGNYSQGIPCCAARIGQAPDTIQTMPL